MNRLFSSASPAALLAAGALFVVPIAGARAQSFTVPTGVTETAPQSVAGTDSGVIAERGALDVDGTAITWSAPATGAGVDLRNNGTIASTGRALDTASDVSGTLTLTNNGDITSGDDTVRINGAFADGELYVVNTGSMTATSGQVFDLNKATAESAYVNIDNSGTITALDNDAIRFGAGTIVLTNSGTIQTLEAESRALKFDGDENIDTLVSFTLINKEGGQILGLDDGFKFAADSDTSDATIYIENHGLIDGGIGQALDFADLTSPDNKISIVNYGTLQSSVADGIRPGAGAVVTNHGIIQSTDLTSDGDGVDFQDAGGTVFNKATGQILGAKHGVTGDGAIAVLNEAGGLIVGRNGSGINVDSSGDTVVTVVNHGTIRGEVTGLIDDDGDPDGVPDGDGDGVDVDGQILLSNYGLIQGTGATGTNDGDPNTADGIAAGGGTIINHAGAVIEAFDNYPNDGLDDVGRAILIDDSSQGAAPFATQIVNEGIIRSDGTAITLIGSQDDTIVNTGLISSDNDVAVDMGGGDDLFVYVDGSEVVGLVIGNDGYNTLELGGLGTFDLSLLGDDAQYRDFSTLFVDEGSSFIGIGSSTFDGEVQIDGTFVLNGSLGSASVGIGEDAVLGGNATLGALAVGAGGTVSPGNSIGTVTVLGTTTFAAGSVYEVELSGLASDQIVTDTLALNGGTVTLSAIGPLYDGTVYDIVSASATTTPMAQFALEDPDFLFVDAELGRDDASVTLTITRNEVALASLAHTANQASVAGALDRADGSLLQGTVLAGTGAQSQAIRAGYDLLSGEVHASVGTTLYFQSTLVADTLIGRLRQTSASGASPALVALATGGPTTAYAAKAPEATSPFPVKALPVEPVGPVYAAWAQGFGQWNSANGTGNSADVDSSLGGFLAGGDVTSGNYTFGLAAGYASATLDVDDRMSSADADTVLLAAYAGASFDAFRLRGGASYGWSDIDTTRSVAMLSLFENPLGSYDGATANVFVEAAYAMEAGGIAFEPFAQMAWSWIDTDSFTETGAFTSGLASSGLSYDVPYSTLGLRLATTLALGEGTVTPHASLAWRHAYGDITPELGMTFASTGIAFSVAGAPIAEDSFLFGAGVDFAVGENVLLNIGYEGQFASDVNSNAIKGGFTYRF
ncbi:outer membrane autotransporter protein [Ancylobacter aquaticus]|uniref:Outer membrane autotransporter protein n=1 Tax=Ancylobacter aquaticus TaxID=100 RepID=A0A4R1HZS7_ANCAQ|nr:autotransporter outer membrane beta-barrel domain-containing protein [Ancylobacter aquaticus]TCK23122.1 outer membrane autotransporter protein [Ancylobacter aquaticus]